MPSPKRVERSSVCEEGGGGGEDEKDLVEVVGEAEDDAVAGDPV